MKTIVYLIVASLITSISSFAQNAKVKDSSSSGFKEYYPIHVKPSIGFMSTIYEGENMIFDAKPTVYYSLFNNMREVMQHEIHKPSYALYLTFQPHIRMYDEDSKPVKMPSYKLLLGGQILTKTPNNNFFAVALESGHYSNGQAGCAFAHGLIDGSEECNQVHQTITNQSNLSELLNRVNGNFSTNSTKLSASFRFNWFDVDDKAPIKALEFSSYWDWYHNNLIGLFDVGGYSDFDISIYGRHRFGLGVEFMHNYLNKLRYTAGIKSENIQGAHPFVDPWRLEFNFTAYPFNNEVGLFVTYVNGHDNYNYRFVDSGNTINVGITWDWFAPFEIKKYQLLLNSL